jgi:indole-3-glycerol phosphate synthase
MNTETATADFLATVVAATRRRLDVRAARTPRAELERAAGARRPRGAEFLERLRMPGRVNVIAECKRRSPSKGILRERYDAADLARQYERAGAAAVSVLTEPTFFDGDMEHLRAARNAVQLPLLCKDFVVSDYQLLEARAAGADAVLLITDALSGFELVTLLKQAEALGLAALVEAHDARDVRRAVAAGAKAVGVNSRNLRTLQMNPDAPLELLPLISGDVIAVAESGIRSAADIQRLRDSGYHAFLVGESLVVQDDPGAALQALVDAGSRDVKDA